MNSNTSTSRNNNLTSKFYSYSYSWLTSGTNHGHTSNTQWEKLTATIQKKYKTLDAKLANLTQEQTKIPRKPHTFYPRLANNTSIKFTERETLLLNKGPKYNLHARRPSWLTDLALEAETAITQLPPSDRDFYRKQIADRVETLHRHRHLAHDKHTHHETQTVNSIQSKLKRNNTTIAKADKGNSLVILTTEQYDSKIQNFLNENKFHKTNTDPTKMFQNKIQKTIKESKLLIPSISTWKYTKLKPISPHHKRPCKNTQT
jgi:hypothetical protein